MSDCPHTETYEREGDTWTDRNGQHHTIIFVRCQYCRRTIKCRQTGADLPVSYAPPMGYVPFRKGKP